MQCFVIIGEPVKKKDLRKGKIEEGSHNKE